MLTLCDPIDYIVPGILQARILEWVAVPFSRGSSQPRDQTQVSHIAGGLFTSWATREMQFTPMFLLNVNHMQTLKKLWVKRDMIFQNWIAFSNLNYKYSNANHNKYKGYQRSKFSALSLFQEVTTFSSLIDFLPDSQIFLIPFFHTHAAIHR